MSAGEDELARSIGHWLWLQATKSSAAMSSSTPIPGWRGVAAFANHDWMDRHGYLAMKLPSLVRGAPRGLGAAPFHERPCLALLMPRIPTQKERVLLAVSSICAQGRLLSLFTAPLETASSAVL